MFINKTQILGATKTLLEGVIIPGSLPIKPAFERVAVYTHDNIAAAIRDLLEFDDRLAFIVPIGDDYENIREGRVMITRKTVEFLILISDRNYGSRVEAMTGSAENPGVALLSDLTVASCVGNKLGLGGTVHLTPGAGEPIFVTADERDSLAGREAWSQVFRTPAGEVRTDVGNR